MNKGSLADQPALALPNDVGLPVDNQTLTLEEHWALCEAMLPIWNIERERNPEKNCPVKEPFIYKS